jgi:hypothetical protein
MGSFDGAGFSERGAPPQFQVWSKGGTVAIKKIPGGSNNVIQKIGVDLPRLALVVKATSAQLTALYGKVGVSGSLVFGYETATATLESIDSVAEQGAGKDVYFATLNLIRSSAVSFTPSTAFLTEAGDTFLTEGGDTFIQE